MPQRENQSASAMTKPVPTSNRYLFARKFVEPSRVGKQKIAEMVSAPTDDATKWQSIDWKNAERQVRRLQVRIAKAVQENKWNKVKILQYKLTHSFHAKAVAVKRVTSNKGKKTPGVDGVLWQGARAKWQAIFSLQTRGYHPQPLRRIYIEKKNGKKRPLSIPTMSDRAMQALYVLALAPVAETTADRNSYGFREGRSCADAVEAAFNDLAQPNSATWVLEADIKGCYDNISHSWMLDNLPMDRVVLKKWLKAGYIENSIQYPTREGTPQGGIASPTLANMTLDGLEKVVRDSAPRQTRVNFVRYADDLIVTCKSKRILEGIIKPAIETFLAERGLTLSEEKTVITHIRDGFTFLGQTFRKHGRALHITPSQKGLLSVMQKAGELIRKHVSAPMPVLIGKLNETLRGWANYHRHVVSADAFGSLDTYIFEQLWRMVKRRHPKKSQEWLTKKYWSAAGRDHIFAVIEKTQNPKKLYQVVRVRTIGIRRHIKVRADANPFLPQDEEYFRKRRENRDSKLRASSARQRRAKKTAQEDTQLGLPIR
jgi:RNA-directed DNA polymerase